MARPLRIEYEGALYHITSRGNHQSNIFSDDKDREVFLEILDDVIFNMGWLCYGYCLMDNHYHLIIETPLANLCKGMRQLNGVYTQNYNRRHDCVGHIFQGRYKSIIVDAEAYLLALSRYVVLNPVRANMVDDVSKWAWSSYRAIAGMEKTPDFLSVNKLLSHFAEEKDSAQHQYVNFIAQGLGKKAIWSDVKQQIFLGDDDFIEKTQHQLKDHSICHDIPIAQQRVPVMSLEEIDKVHDIRDEAIIEAYKTGVYSYSQIADYFSIHFSTVGRVVRKANKVQQ